VCSSKATRSRRASQRTPLRVFVWTAPTCSRHRWSRWTRRSKRRLKLPSTTGLVSAAMWTRTSSGHHCFGNPRYMHVDGNNDHKHFLYCQQHSQKPWSKGRATRDALKLQKLAAEEAETERLRARLEAKTKKKEKKAAEQKAKKACRGGRGRSRCECRKEEEGEKRWQEQETNQERERHL
jgi:hypothetical protein